MNWSKTVGLRSIKTLTKSLTHVKCSIDIKHNFYANVGSCVLIIIAVIIIANITEQVTGACEVAKMLPRFRMENRGGEVTEPG